VVLAHIMEPSTDKMGWTIIIIVPMAHTMFWHQSYTPFSGDPEFLTPMLHPRPAMTQVLLQTTNR